MPADDRSVREEVDFSVATRPGSPPHHLGRYPTPWMPRVLSGLEAEGDATLDVTSAAAKHTSKSDQPSMGQDFGEYELVEEIARGGMGVVYKARQKRLNRTVALKMILAGEFAGQAEIQRFHTEAEAAANLQHSGIVPIYEVGHHQGQHFFSMGFIEGSTLSHSVQNGPLDGRTAATLLVKVANTIAYAHQQGVVHRDLKPGKHLDRSPG